MNADRYLLAGALAVWIAGIVVVLAAALPLGHDEAAYAIGAQRLIDGEPQIWLHRSLGTAVLAIPGLLAGSETAMRVPSALLAITVPLGGYALARAAGTSGGWVAALLASAHPMLAHTGELLSDLPAAGLILLALALIVRELSRADGARWAIVGAAPLLAGAFYLRYGCAPVLATIAVAAAIAYRRAIIRRPVPVLALVGATGLMIIPHVVYSLAVTGEVLGVVGASADATTLHYTGEGLVTYLTVNPLRYCGVVIAPVALAGIVLGLARGDTTARMLVVAALVSVVAIGIRSHAEPRYLYPLVAMLAVAGVAGLARLRAGARWQIAALVIVALAWIGGLVHAYAATAKKRAFRDQVETIGHAIARDAGTRPCLLVTQHIPQLAYYSGCKGEVWPDAPRPGGRRVYVISILSTHRIDPASVSPDTRPLAGVEGVFVVDQ